MVYYLRGQLDLHGPLLAAFFERASEATRRHAMRFVGRVLYDDGDLDADLEAGPWHSGKLGPRISTSRR